MNALTPSTLWTDTPEPGESQAFEAFAVEINQSQQNVSAQSGHPPMRGLHAKSHVGVLAEFRVLDSLPAHARHGVFQQAHEYEAVVRFSNGKPTLHADRKPEPRGIALKLIDVAGPKVEKHVAASTQDFLATSHSVTSTIRNARQFIAFIRAERL